jgi:hypothetical protein
MSKSNFVLSPAVTQSKPFSVLSKVALAVSSPPAGYAVGYALFFLGDVGDNLSSNWVLNWQPALFMGHIGGYIGAAVGVGAGISFASKAWKEAKRPTQQIAPQTGEISSPT